MSLFALLCQLWRAQEVWGIKREYLSLNSLLLYCLPIHDIVERPSAMKATSASVVLAVAALFELCMAIPVKRDNSTPTGKPAA